MDNVFLTKSGLNKFKNEFSQLTEKRKDAVLNLARAREMGDLSENGFYKAARLELSSIDRRLREISFILKKVQVIKKSSSKTVGLANLVRILTDGKSLEYQIVGKYEANPSEGKISNESPVGKLILGKKTGEAFVFGGKSFKILKIS